MFSFSLPLAAAAGGAASPGAAAPAAQIPVPAVPRPGERLILTGAGDSLRLSILEAEEAERPLPLPLLTELATRGTARPFGSEQRCRVAVEEGGPAVHCAPGAAPAGMVLALDGSVASGARLVARLRTAGSEGFAAQLVAAGADADAPTALAAGAVDLGVGSGVEEAQLTVVAPPEGGTLRLQSLMLLPASTAPPVETSASAWVWEPAAWLEHPEALVANARARGITRLSITVPVEGGLVAEPEPLARFISLARRSGIAVHAVEGDPHMVEAAGLRRALERARALRTFQRQAPEDGRLAGVEYDIEPYSLPGWSKAPADFEAWARAVIALAEAAGAPVDLVVPPWLPGSARGRAFLDKVKPSISGVTAMAYRTDAAAVSVAAQPLLDWGAASGKPVRIALEAGPLADEYEEIFVPAETGTVAILPGGGEVAQVFAAPTQVPGATMYRSLGRTRVAAGRISFLGDEARMMAVSIELQPAFAAWPSFAGFAFHGLNLQP